MAQASLWKLRRLAPRAKRVIERRRGEAPVIAAYEPTMVSAADGYMAAYDQAARYRVIWKQEMAESTEAVAVLTKSLRSWIPLIGRDVGGFDGSVFLDTAVPDDVISDGEQILATVATRVAEGRAALPYEVALVADVTEKVEAAKKEHAEAEAADKVYQERLAEARRAAEIFHNELRTFRRTVAALVGRQDKDYQKLRMQRAAQRDEDDDPNAPAPPDGGDEIG
jgi:hypothetical protein